MAFTCSKATHWNYLIKVDIYTASGVEEGGAGRGPRGGAQPPSCDLRELSPPSPAKFLEIRT